MKKQIVKYGWIILVLFIPLAVSFFLKEKSSEPIFTEEIMTVKVDIKGAVEIPGLYEVKEGSRIEDVIKLAGGLTEDADTSFINLSKIVEDEMVIIIDTKEEIESNKEESVQKEISSNRKEEEKTIDSSNSKISINKASKSELLKIPGIGSVKAEAILQYRGTNGFFQKLEDIQKVKGIGSQTYEKIKDYITL